MEAQGHAERGGSSGGVVDYYRLLRIDPDAPQELVAEAYWCLARSLQQELPSRKAAQRDLDALNAAYSVLVDPQKREAYDETVPRVLELRQERAKRFQAQKKKRSTLAHLFGKPQHNAIDLFQLLRLDPEAEPFLIARAYLIMRTLYSKGEVAGASAEQLALLAQARPDLLRKRIEDEPHRTETEAAVEPPTAPPSFLTADHVGSTNSERHE